MKRLILFGILFFNFSQTIFAKKMNIEIVPVGQIEYFVIEHLKEKLSDVFMIEVSTEVPYPVLEHAFNKKRGQYHSSQILSALGKHKKFKNRKIILAVIDKDLYVPGLNFVFGEANPQDKICIISITRLCQTWWGLTENKELFLRRILKEAVHEIGHVFGLRHCRDPKCVMHFSNSLGDTDVKDFNFCNKCKKN
jgi:archaemetzincin